MVSLGSCVVAYVATYCQQAGIDARDMSVAVTFDKVENPTRLTNLKVVVKLPHGDCQARKQTMLRVAEHCPVHETIVTPRGVDLVVLDRSELVPA